LSAAKQHDIQGSLDTSGGLTLGAGIYTFDGYFALGASSGGSVSCNGQSVSLSAQDVSLVLSGNPTHTSGTCKGYAFCASAGFSGMTLVSPSSGTMENLAIIGPSDNNAGAYFAAGASGGAFSGALYFPNGPVAMSGGASVGGATGGCLEIIGSHVTLSGGTTAASECIASSASGNGKVSLVQ
jgi:hypothetical protein